MFQRLLILVLFVGWLGRSIAAPHIVLVVTDDQRPDTVHSLGNPHISTPNLDRLVREGVSFSQAFCSFPLCVPSRAEILTGKVGWRNGVYEGRSRLKPDSVFVGDALRKQGYETVYCGKWMNDGKPLTRGYDRTKALFSSGGAGKEGKAILLDDAGREITGYRGWTFKDEQGKAELDKGIGVVAETSEYIADGAVDVLKEERDKPLFLHVNFTAPHDPLIVPKSLKNRYPPSSMRLPPNFLSQHPFDHGNLTGRDERLLPLPRDPEEVKELLSRYYAVIEEMDKQFGRIMETLRSEPYRGNTVVIFTSDHGLGMGSHGLLGKQNMYEHTMRVPFIMSGPGMKKGTTSDSMVILRDLFPTLVDWAGGPVPEGLDGRSLLNLFRSDAPEWRDHITGMFYDHQRMIRTDRWKFIWYPKLDRLQLFDLKEDPSELNNLHDQVTNASLVKNLKRRLIKEFQSLGDPLVQE